MLKISDSLFNTHVSKPLTDALYLFIIADPNISTMAITARTVMTPLRLEYPTEIKKGRKYTLSKDVSLEFDANI